MMINLALNFTFRSALNTFIQHFPHLCCHESLIKLTLFINSSNKWECIDLLKNILHFCSDSMILNAILRLSIEIGDYDQSCFFYNKWKEVNFNFGYLETLMISCVDGSLTLSECTEMAIRLNGKLI
jgi:hypothetical protein